MFKIAITTVDITLVALGCLMVFLLVTRTSRIPKGTHLPPGPPGKAIIGNIFDIPKKHEWETYTRWAKKYGDLVHVEVFRKHMVFVNSITAAQEIFEKRSSLYSDRFDAPMMCDLMGFDWTFVLMHYGNRWRRHRKAFYQKFHPAATTAYYNIQVKQTQELLRRFRESPEDFLRHLRHHSGAIIMEIIYGIKVLPTDDPYLKIAEDAMAAVSAAVNPGTFLVDAFPILKYIPEWVPGAGFKAKARVWRKASLAMLVVPFNACKKALREGTAIPSFISSSLEKLGNQTDADAEEEIIRNVGAAAYGGGADTTTVALSWFMLAMILYPDVQRKAQAELDEVIGWGRLPGFEDSKKLPYMNALCKEIQRWHPVFPLGVAHRLVQDDVYNNMFLPKGTIVIGNSWALLHDEKSYGPNPENFNPERFFDPGVRDPSPAFGFGRRICPGRHLAENTIFIAASSILKIYNISRARDADGAEMPIGISSTSGAIPRPNPFLCSITLRSELAAGLLGQYQE